jgi:hypothetical protein
VCVVRCTVVHNNGTKAKLYSYSIKDTRPPREGRNTDGLVVTNHHYASNNNFNCTTTNAEIS